MVDQRNEVIVSSDDRSSQDMVLSLFVPGLGQLVQGRRVAAATQFGTVIGYVVASVVGAGGRAWWIALAWNAWTAFDAYRHG
jgi:hypothetical protein